jgi:hypothetical protein
MHHIPSIDFIDTPIYRGVKRLQHFCCPPGLNRAGSRGQGVFPSPSINRGVNEPRIKHTDELVQFVLEFSNDVLMLYSLIFPFIIFRLELFI